MGGVFELDKGHAQEKDDEGDPFQSCELPSEDYDGK